MPMAQSGTTELFPLKRTIAGPASQFTVFIGYRSQSAGRALASVWPNSSHSYAVVA